MQNGPSLVSGAVFFCFLIVSSTCLGEVGNDVSYQSDSTESDFESKGQSVIQPDQTSCTTCTLMALALKVKFESLQREDMIAYALKLCSTLNKLSDPCANIVSNYFEEVYELVLDQLQSNEICTSSGICTVGFPKTRQELLVPQKRNFQIFCTDCEKITRHAQQSLLKNMSVGLFKQKLKEMCTLTLSFETDCLLYADQYYHEIYTMMNRKLNSSQICQFIGACHNAQSQHENLLDFSPELENSISILNHNHYDSIDDLKLPQCSLCKIVFAVVKPLIKKGVSKEKVLKAISAACNKLGKFAHKCHDFVNKHGDRILHVAGKPKSVCILLGMCFPFAPLEKYEINDAQKKENILTPIVNSTQVLVHGHLIRTNFSPNCNFCMNIIQTLQKFVNQHYDMKTALDSVCSVQPNEDLKNKCWEMLETHKLQIIELLSKNVAYQEICRTINMCSLLEDGYDIQLVDTFPKSTNDELIQNMMQYILEDIQLVETFPESTDDEYSIEKIPFLVEQHNWLNGAECYVCKKVIKEFKKFAEHHNDKGSIERAVHQICHKLGKLSHKCEKLAEKHLNKIVDLILKRVNNKKICKTIGMCKSSIRNEDVELFQKNTETSKALQGLQLENPKQGPFRLICELVLEKFEMLLDTNEKRNHILHRMLFTCDKLPTFMREPCQDVIHSYGYALLDLLSKLTPHEFCHILANRLDLTN
ncbi:prosaposin-like isoform X2 [Drosophila nasuta]|uniref:prosaposin-like isoform X2 n=1 Tax=Drosophila nasuta TaxID=42062 RepID=UPI00295E8B10|nr:prosaposin-like isoform X2 [Drosophila nasuta]